MRLARPREKRPTNLIIFSAHDGGEEAHDQEGDREYRGENRVGTAISGGLRSRALWVRPPPSSGTGPGPVAPIARTA